MAQLARIALCEHPAPRFEVVAARSLAAGLLLLAESHFDAAILDLGLPDSQGAETVERVCSQFPQLPMVVLSGTRDLETIHRAMQAGAQHYILKGPALAHLLPRSVEFAVTHKRAEEALRRSESELKAIYENAPIMMCVLDADRKVLYANRAFADFLGRPAEELQMERACGVIGCVRALDDPRGCGYGPRCATCNVRLAMVDAVESGTSHRGFEYRTTALRRGQPRESVFLASVAPIRMSGRTNLLLCLEDITDRELVEAALRDSEERYRSLFSSSQDAVIVTVPDGRILAANEAACRMFGRPEQELVDLGRSCVMDASDPRLPAALEERQRTGRFRGELLMVRKDGSTFPAEISSAFFADRNGRTCSSVVIRDVSERHRVEAEQRASREQLRALAGRLQEVREEERTRVAREIHDVLAQELTRLKLDLVWVHRRLARGDASADPEVLAGRLSEMIGLADSAIGSVQRVATELRPVVLDSLGLFAAVEWLARDFQDHAGIPCRVRLPDVEPPVGHEAATAAFRILQESLTNVQRHAGARQVEIDVTHEGDHLVLVVRDDGRGMSPEALASPLSIGLAGMRERALILGGRCEIRSGTGQGTTIEVRVPIAERGTEKRA